MVPVRVLPFKGGVTATIIPAATLRPYTDEGGKVTANGAREFCRLVCQQRSTKRALRLHSLLSGLSNSNPVLA